MELETLLEKALQLAANTNASTAESVGPFRLKHPHQSGQNGEKVCLWHVDAERGVEHPLQRQLLHQPKSFFLLTAHATTEASDSDQAGLTERRELHVGASTLTVSERSVWTTANSATFLQPLSLEEASHESIPLVAWTQDANGEPVYLACVREPQAADGDAKMNCQWVMDQKVACQLELVEEHAKLQLDPVVGKVIRDPFRSVQIQPTRLGLRFDILNDDLAMEGEQPERCKIVMHVEWTHDMPFAGDVSIDQLLASPPSSSENKLVLRAVHGSRDLENHEPTSKTLHQLINLNKLELMSSSKRPIENWFGSTGSNTGTSANVKAFIDELISEGGYPTTAVPTDTSLGHLPERNDLDVTERIWSFAQGALNQDDLIETLVAIAEELETGRLQPLVHRTNQSQFATLVRDCLKLAKIQTSRESAELKDMIGRQFDFWLERKEGEPALVLKLMMEIGVGKLRRDYAHWLIGSNLLTAQQFDDMFDTNLQLSEQIQRLHYLHRIVELWSLLRQNVLCLPFENVRACVQRAYGFWMGIAREDVPRISYDETVTYQFPFPKYSHGSAQVLRTIQNSFQPSELQATLTSVDGEVLYQLLCSRENMNEQAGFGRKDAFRDSDPMMVDGRERWFVHVASWEKHIFSNE